MPLKAQDSESYTIKHLPNIMITKQDLSIPWPYLVIGTSEVWIQYVSSVSCEFTLNSTPCEGGSCVSHKYCMYVSMCVLTWAYPMWRTPRSVRCFTSPAAMLLSHSFMLLNPHSPHIIQRLLKRSWLGAGRLLPRSIFRVEGQWFESLTSCEKSGYGNVSPFQPLSAKHTGVGRAPLTRELNPPLHQRRAVQLSWNDHSG